jgi:AhpD family alkylhydroperoxidase
MERRLDHNAAAPEAMAAMRTFETAMMRCGLEHGLIELVKIRASQLNGCAFCLHMHTRDARAAGEREERLHLLAAWRESSLFSERERAALAWTEALTLVAVRHPTDAEFQDLARQFAEREIVELSLVIGAINVWNRLAVGFRTPHPPASS